MTTIQEQGLASPWMTIWLSPRRTIDNILATRPRHLVWLLASLGAIAGFYAQLLGLGITSQLLDWRFLLGFVFGSGVVGVGLLYLSALIFSWIARLFGGRASALELRAAFAWSGVPSILGFVIVLALAAGWRFLGNDSAAVPGGVSLLPTAIIAVCGFWSFVVLLLMLSRVEQFGFWRTLTAYVLVVILPALLAAFAIRTFLFQPFSTPSNSMAPTLQLGDHFFASKYAYGYTHYSLPLSPPLFSGRIFGSEPARGDVVVFRLPKDGLTDYVKRVVGLPGDRIQMMQGLLYINGTPVKRERLTDFAGGEVCGSESAGVKRWRETLPNGVSHETLDCIDNGFYDDTNVYTVPAGHFFMVGDNRDNSTDSRVLSAVGYIPLENIIGRVGLIFFSHAPGSDTAAAAGSGRFGLVVH